MGLDEVGLMRKCPTCGAALPEGMEYCPPSNAMKNNRGSKVPAFTGCYSIRMEEVFNGRPRGDKHHPKRGSTKPLTDYQRARAAYGKHCILSPFGPLPIERDVRSSPVEGDLWGDYEHPDTNFVGSGVGREL